MASTTESADIFKQLLRLFRIDSEFVSYTEVGSGNINKTYILTCRKDGKIKNYMAQKVNTYAFKNPDRLMSNIDLVTEYLRANHPDRINLHFHHTADGKAYAVIGEQVWRLFNCIRSVTFDTCSDKEILCNTGIAFGRFQMDLRDFDASKLYETIPDFHNTRKRIEHLMESVREDPYGRAKEAEAELEYIDLYAEKSCTLVDMQMRGELPLRVTHNDTKINNVLFDEKTKEPICVIDLDTVMPGLVAYDFADAVRFACNTEPEDSRNVEKVSFDIGLYEAFAGGFLSQIGQILTKNECETLPLGCFAITLELACRFLDDYICGDKYFKTLYPGHNLDRTRCQLALAEDMRVKKQQIMDKTGLMLCAHGLNWA